MPTSFEKVLTSYENVPTSHGNVPSLALHLPRVDLNVQIYIKQAIFFITLLQLLPNSTILTIS